MLWCVPVEMGERFSSGLDRRGAVRLRGESSVVMGRQWGIIRRRFFGIPSDAISFDRRGFPGRNALARQRLEHAAGQFVDGYHLALECGEWRQAAAGLRELGPDALDIRVPVLRAVL